MFLTTEGGTMQFCEQLSLFASKFILVMGRFKGHPLTEGADVKKKNYRTVLNSSKMKLGTCASATLLGSFVYRT